MTSETVQVDGVQLNVTSAGAGPPILFVHGFPLDHTVWHYQLENLSSTFHVIAPDLRGFGSNPPAAELSMSLLADDLAALLGAIGVEQPVTFCGLSMGGYIGWEFWRRHPGRLGQLVMCDTRAMADTVEVARGRQLAADRVLQEGVGFLIDSLLPKLFADASLKRRTQRVEQIKQTMLRTSPATVAAALRGMATRQDFSPMLDRLELPALLICGEHDVISPPAEMQLMAASMPRASFVPVKDAGHMAPVESPEAVSKAIADFLGRVHSAR